MMALAWIIWATLTAFAANLLWEKHRGAAIQASLLSVGSFILAAANIVRGL